MNMNHLKPEPYLFFNGRGDEAIELYKKVLGAEVLMLMRFKDSPEPPQQPLPPGYENKIMHASLGLGGTRLMVSDGMCSGKPSFEGFSLSLNARDEAEAKKLFAGLSEGGQVQVPLGKTFFSPCFGMTHDRFGVLWMVLVQS